MLKKLSNILLLFSLVIIVGHNITAHHHHSEYQFAQNALPGDSENDHEHNIFSFGQLDESYLHSNDQFVLDTDFVFFLNYQSLFSLHTVPQTLHAGFIKPDAAPLADNYPVTVNSRRGPPHSLS